MMRSKKEGEMKNIIGVVENATSAHLKGFICIPKNAQLPELTVYVDSKMVGVVSYGEERELPFAVKAYICREFGYVFSRPLVGKHVVSVRTPDRVDIQNSPFLYCSDSLSNCFKNTSEIKAALSQTFVSGDGIEIGALDNPFPLSGDARVKYLDRMESDKLREQYPELLNKNIVNVDIVDDGESLASVSNDSQKFIIASHFFEHAKNPILFLFSCLRVLKVGGIILLVIPDKRHTFDIDRPLTSFDHIDLDYKFGHDAQKHEHFNEIAYFQKKLTGEDAIKEIERMDKSDYSYHWHVWTSNSFLYCISSIVEKYTTDLEIILFLKGKGEFYLVLMKK